MVHGAMANFTFLLDTKSIMVQVIQITCLSSARLVSSAFIQYEQIFADVNISVFQIAAATESIVF